MKRILSMTLLIAAAAVPGLSQTSPPPTSQCTLKVAQAPTIRGLKLGMRMDEVLTMFPGSRDNDQYIRGLLAEESAPFLFGVVSFNISPTMYPGKERFAGVLGLYFRFIDSRLVQYTIQYGRPPWPRVDDFINKTAEALKLPQADSWAADKSGYKSLACDGFLIRASAQNGGGYLTLQTGEDPNEVQRKRRADTEEQERRVFKP